MLQSISLRSKTPLNYGSQTEDIGAAFDSIVITKKESPLTKKSNELIKYISRPAQHWAGILGGLERCNTSFTVWAISLLVEVEDML